MTSHVTTTETVTLRKMAYDPEQGMVFVPTQTVESTRCSCGWVSGGYGKRAQADARRHLREHRPMPVKCWGCAQVKQTIDDPFCFTCRQKGLGRSFYERKANQS